MSGWILLLLAQASPAADTPVPDATLAQQRGGFRLPSGIDVALSVQTQTAIDGAVVLRTVFSVDQGKPTLSIHAPAPGQTVAAGGGANGPGRPAGTPVVAYDPRTGLSVTPGMAAPPVTISTGAASRPDAGPALPTVAAGATTAAGTVSEATTNGLRTVSLEGADFIISHVAGNAFGSSITNTGNDRTIDTQTTLAIDLRGAAPDVLGSAMFRVENVAIQAMSIRP